MPLEELLAHENPLELAILYNFWRAQRRKRETFEAWKVRCPDQVQGLHDGLAKLREQGRS